MFALGRFQRRHFEVPVKYVLPELKKLQRGGAGSTNSYRFSEDYLRLKSSKLKRAINTFVTFKSADMDGISLNLFENKLDFVTKLLLGLFKACLALGCILSERVLNPSVRHCSFESRCSSLIKRGGDPTLARCFTQR